MNKVNVIFRCDGSACIGLGHLVRCLALADGLRREGFSEITFLTKDYDKLILDKIRGRKFLVEALPYQAYLDEDLKRIIEMVRENDRTVVVIDSYAIDTTYLEELKNTGALLICIDDLAQIHFPSDVVLNQNIYALEMKYSVEAQTKLLLGPRYALLRRGFLERHGERRLVKEKVGSVIVIMGGGDPDNQTLRVAEALGELDGSEGGRLVVHLVVGVGYQYHRQLCSASIARNPRVNVAHDPENLPQLMAEADLAVSAGGSTCYELAYLGVPNIIISLAGNQKKIAERLDAEGASRYLGYYEEVSVGDIKKTVENLMGDYERRKKMSSKGKKLVDGHGVKRVVKEVKELIKDL